MALGQVSGYTFNHLLADQVIPGCGPIKLDQLFTSLMHMYIYVGGACTCMLEELRTDF